MVSYLLIGIICGFIITYVGCKICDIDFSGGHFGPSPGAILTFLGAIIGAAVGLGFGVVKLSNGTLFAH